MDALAGDVILGTARFSTRKSDFAVQVHALSIFPEMPTLPAMGEYGYDESTGDEAHEDFVNLSKLARQNGMVLTMLPAG